MSDAAHDHGHAEEKGAHDECCGHDHGHAEHGHAGQAEHGHAEHGHAEHGHAEKGADDCCGHDHGHAEKGHSEHSHAEKAEHGHVDHGHAHDDCCGDKSCPSNKGADLTTPPSAADGDDVCGDGGLFKKLIKEGDAALGSPPPGSEVTVHYTGTLLDGSKFDSSVDRGQKFKFTIGQRQVIKGWDEGVATMKKGEKAILTCREDYAYGAHGSAPKIPGGATLLFEVELFSWKEKRKQRRDLSDAEVVPEATARKAKGTEHFKAGRFDSAYEDYEDAASLLQMESGEEPKALLLSCNLNMATCALKQGEWAQAAEAAANALAADGASVKALFRRGHARMELGDFEGAQADLREANRLDPKSKEVRDMFAACKEREKEVARADRALYSKMLGAK